MEDKCYALRKAARKRLKNMCDSGNIKDWDFSTGENLFYITLLTGQEIQLDAQGVKWFQLGVLSAIYQASGAGAKAINNLLSGGNPRPLDNTTLLQGE